MNLSYIFAGERTHPEDEEGINISRYDFAGKSVKGKTVIDLGCGSGYGTWVLANNGAKMAIGIDYDPKVIQYAKKKYKLRNLKYQNVNSSILTKRDKFQIVTAFEVIEHIKDDFEFVRLIKELLAQNGIAFISTPNKLISSPGMDTPPNPYHIREYTPTDFKKILSNDFSSVVLYGLKVKNQKIKAEEDSVHSSLRWKIASAIVRVRIIRKLMNYFPRDLKRKVTGEHKLKFSREDFGLVQGSINTAPYMLAICSQKNK